MAMIVTRKHLSRRAVLRGAGAALALPFLDAMHPALTAERLTAAAPVRRLVLVHYPHGVVDETWNPAGEGSNYTMSDSLSPLARHRQKFIVFRGLSSCPDRSRPEFHDRAIATFLTGCEPTPRKVQVGISADQVAAKMLGRQTRFASLELAIEPLGQFGSLCYADANTNLPVECNPRLLFERLFGDNDKVDPAAQARRAAEDLSILDGVTERIARLKHTLHTTDRRKLDQYLEAIRDVERRVNVAASGPATALPDFVRPAGIPEQWPDHVMLMFDLQALALQADLTRVITFSMAGEGTILTFRHLNQSMNFHEISHHNNQRHKLDALSKINKDQSKLFAYYLDKLDAVTEAAGSVLDQSAIFYGSTLSNPSIHKQRDLPIIVAGGAGGRLKGGRYVRIPGDDTPLTNLHLAILDKLDVPIERLGDSTVPLNELEA